MKVKVKRIYDKPDKKDGFRILVDRLWPRGLTKQKAQVDLWLKDVAPSTELRQWFKHDAAKWADFQTRYQSELAENPAVEDLVKQAKKGKTTLLYGAKDTTHNHAIVLKNYLGKRL